MQLLLKQCGGLGALIVHSCKSVYNLYLALQMGGSTSKDLAIKVFVIL